MKVNVQKKTKLWQSGGVLVVLYFLLLLIFFLIFTPGNDSVLSNESSEALQVNWKDVTVDTNAVYDYTTILPNSVKNDAWQIQFLENKYNINIEILGNFSEEE